MRVPCRHACNTRANFKCIRNVSTTHAVKASIYMYRMYRHFLHDRTGTNNKTESSGTILNNNYKKEDSKRKAVRQV